MIKAEFIISDLGNIYGFDISGHSGYSDQGYDIICAAVSSAAYMTVNTLTEIIGAEVSVNIEDDIGHMRAVVSKKDVSRCKDILKGFKTHMILLEEIYFKNIKVSYAEV